MPGGGAHTARRHRCALLQRRTNGVLIGIIGLEGKGWFNGDFFHFWRTNGILIRVIGLVREGGFN